MGDAKADAEIERIARELAARHGAAFSHSNRDGEMQTVASSYAGHRWAHAVDEYAAKRWRQYRGAARYLSSCLADEREEVARLLWAEARRMEQKGNDERITPNMDESERQRTMSRAGSWFGQSTAFERAAWMVLARSGPSDANFFNKE